jgi:hypothetical protein
VISLKQAAVVIGMVVPWAWLVVLDRLLRRRR